jgi:hypothetical protein
MRAIVLDSLHYILNGDRREELYRLKEDPDERTDLGGQPTYQPELGRHREALRIVGPRATP